MEQNRKRAHRRSNQRGATFVEYALLIALIGLVTASAAHAVGRKISDIFVAGGGSMSTMTDDDGECTDLAGC